jgi:pimeloyl-ACP methyl ester carboxylesterase
MAGEPLEPRPFEVESSGARLVGEEVGEGPAVVVLHGITATRRYVLHGSVALARKGYRLISYDARGHGESSSAPEGEGYGYEQLTADLRAVLAERCPNDRPVLCGHSMGCHTAAAHALDHAPEIAALVPIGPVTIGIPASEQTLAHWDRLADGLEQDRVDGFMKVYEADLNVTPDWRETALRITRERIQLHRHPEALAEAIRQVPRSQPFEDLSELESLDLPALVVASQDEADPNHPYSVAEAWAERLPRGRLVSEEPGESPLAWQGGRLSRAIAEFCQEPAVLQRLSGAI